MLMLVSTATSQHCFANSTWTMGLSFRTPAASSAGFPSNVVADKDLSHVVLAICNQQGHAGGQFSREEQQQSNGPHLLSALSAHRQAAQTQRSPK
jgi:hypothetical protein